MAFVFYSTINIIDLSDNFKYIQKTTNFTFNTNKTKNHARANHTYLSDEVRYYWHNHRQRRTSLLQSSDKNLHTSFGI